MKRAYRTQDNPPRAKRRLGAASTYCTCHTQKEVPACKCCVLRKTILSAHKSCRLQHFRERDIQHIDHAIHSLGRHLVRVGPSLLRSLRAQHLCHEGFADLLPSGLLQLHGRPSAPPGFRFLGGLTGHLLSPFPRAEPPATAPICLRG